MKEGKEIYDNIVIPEELPERVIEAIASVDKAAAKKRAANQKRKRRMRTAVRSTGTLAAAFLVCFTLGINTSTAFAQEMNRIPVIGLLARVLTVRFPVEEDESIDMNLEVPQIELFQEPSSKKAAKTVEEVNQQIQSIVEAHIEKAREDMAEYKEAFFSTGGTEEQWQDRTMDVHVSYEVKYQSEQLLSLVLITEEAWVAAYGESIYYNLNLDTGDKITLEDMLGIDYVAIANAEIVRQIEERIKEDEYLTYFGWEEEEENRSTHGFQTINADTAFYLNEKGKVVICFPKYEIAPGYMGIQEFEIVP